MTKQQAEGLQSLVDAEKFKTKVVRRGQGDWRLEIINCRGHLFAIHDYDLAWKVQMFACLPIGKEVKSDTTNNLPTLRSTVQL